MSARDVIDPDTRRSLSAGRETAGEMLVAARSKLRRVFVVFAVGLLATVYAMRVWIWPILKRDLLARGADVVVLTPFDVILLQAKIGIAVGILLSIPPFLYYARDPLKRRGLYPEEGIANWKLAGIAVLSTLLFAGGIAYSYNLFFPLMFDFLAHNAISAGLSPTYSIVDWTQFILVLGLAFGLAAQLPLLMTGLSYTGIVPYETFRDKWKYAIVAMFGFGALFSPPDPFTQVMWAAPLVVLYGFSLYLARLAVAFRRGREAMDLAATVRGHVPQVAGSAILVGGVAHWILADGIGYANRVLLPRFPSAYRPGPVEVNLPFGAAGPAVVGVALGIITAVVAALYYSVPRLEPGGDPRRIGDPEAIDLVALDAEALRAAPPEAFMALSEDDAVGLAGEAIDAGDPERARAILDGYDMAERQRAVDELYDPEAAAEAQKARKAAAAERRREERAGALRRSTAGVLSAFTEEDVDEDDVGGYAYDAAFVLSSLRSKAFRIFTVFILVLAGVFTFLYSGGIGAIKRDFLRRLPAIVRPEEVNVITLHPVEALVFEVKIATLLGLVATLPLLLYYAWPALKSRGLVRGDRSVFFTWAGALFVGLLAGSAVGYLYVAPGVISYLVFDGIRAGMVISYRVSNFFWLVFFTTVGIGLWIDIPVTMFLFHRAGIVSYPAMRQSWRGVTVGVLVFAAVFTPASVLSMVLVTIPVMLGYGLGLGALWLYTLGGRRTPRAAARSG